MYGRFARLLRMVYRFFHPNWQVQHQQDLTEPVVFVVHHQNMFGPVHTLGLLENEARPWIFVPFLERHSCFEQFYGYTFRQRLHWPRLPAFLLAKLLSRLLPQLMQSLGAIAVYRDKRAVKTIRHSLAALQRGESLVICPDEDYTNATDQIGEIQTGFLTLDRLYHKKNGRHLAFVPVRIEKKSRQIWLGEAVRFRDGHAFTPESYRVSALLRSEINNVGGAASIPAEQKNASSAQGAQTLPSNRQKQV